MHTILHENIRLKAIVSMAVGCSYILLLSLGIIAQQGTYGRIDYISLLVQYWGNAKRVFSSFPSASSRGLSGA